MTDTIYEYGWKQAVEDGILVKIFENRWPELTHGTPILATVGTFKAFSLAAFQEMWNAFVIWKKQQEPESARENMFVTKMNGKDVWVTYDVVYTFLFPEEY
jgi:hypothetical protein